MEVYERIRFLRKNILKMTMVEFGKQLGVSRDVINNIERNRLARPGQKLNLMKLICKTFNVREEWLLYGNEPMIDPLKGTADLNEMLMKEGVRPEDMDLLKAILHIYISLKPESQKEAYTILSKYVETNEDRKR